MAQISKCILRGISRNVWGSPVLGFNVGACSHARKPMSCCSAARQTSSRTPTKSISHQLRASCPETQAWAGWLMAITPSVSFRSNMNHPDISAAGVNVSTGFSCDAIVQSAPPAVLHSSIFNPLLVEAMPCCVLWWQSLYYRKSFSLQPLAQRGNVFCIACFHHTMHGDSRNVVVREGTVVGNIDDTSAFLRN